MKILCPEKLTSLEISNRGAYCAGGTENGKIYLWEVCLYMIVSKFVISCR